MLTNQLLSYYNHLLAASLMYLTMIDPLKDIANTLSGHMEEDHQRLPNLAFAHDMTGQEQEYYKTLGVNKDASKQEIHRAFRQLAKKYHPDKNKDKTAPDEFIKIFKAYQVLSDEKKRKEYDNRPTADSYQHGDNSWSTTPDMSNFDVNEFLRQYEDQFLKHAQHHQQARDPYHHHQHHQQYEQHHHDKLHFHGINLYDLLHDIDDDELNSFGGGLFDMSNHIHSQTKDGHFGDGASFFGTHFPSQIHDTLHQYQHQYQHQHQHQRNIHGGQQHQGGGGYACHTVTKQINGMIMTQTSCS